MRKKLFSLLLLVSLLSAVLCGCKDGSTERPSADGQEPAIGSTGETPPANEITVGIAQDLDDSEDQIQCFHVLLVPFKALGPQFYRFRRKNPNVTKSIPQFPVDCKGFPAIFRNFLS